MRFYDLNQGFGVVVDLVKHPMHLSNIRSNHVLSLTTYLVSKDWIRSLILAQTKVLFCGSILVSRQLLKIA